MSKRIKTPDDKTDPDLQSLLESYKRKSEELELKENTLLRQMEVMQSAVASLRQWNEQRKSSTGSPALPDPNATEEETKQIREETARIQEEIEKKIEENRILKMEVEMRKRLHDERREMEEKQTREVECRRSPGPEDEPSLEFFQKKLSTLKEMQKALKEESRQKIEENKNRKRELERKIERLQWDLEIDRNILETVKKTN